MDIDDPDDFCLYDFDDDLLREFEEMLGEYPPELPIERFHEDETSNKCKHEFVIVGYGLSYKPYYNCKHCDIKKEDVIKNV
jgi:hypothetical protein